MIHFEFAFFSKLKTIRLNREKIHNYVLINLLKPNKSNFQCVVLFKKISVIFTAH